MAIETFPVELAWRRHATPHVLHLAFRPADGSALGFVPGQFLNLHFETEHGNTHRSYSIANPPGADGLMEIAMSPVPGGLASDALAALEPGDVIQASGPFGRFVLREEPACRYVLVGTGTGITPYRAMLPTLQQRLGEGFKVHILIGVWRREELLFGADFRAFADGQEGAEFSACYSREFPADPGPWEHSGYVQTRFAHLGLDPEKDIVYLCGNPGMIDESVEVLKAMGFTLKQLRREKYLSARPAR
ncbi:FAD-binding oxidoreductase [Thioalkalivibrio sp. XN279]|uniref:FAD-binding oxidoreductase n=1 Tax=Thioalkalivibrio sp. XN279 TaxID=2714953 RepID=UPI00140A35F5|nr:FAD-binding oxidoreductase [Thioalkalivibrio sp. XN279]NHA15562.1 ferredoxin--NADP reductase [Thioalkalivibrio sp. XN279]